MELYMAANSYPLSVYWNTTKKDYIVQYPLNKEDGQLVIDHVLAKSFLDEMTKRGYDMSTLKFELHLVKQNKTATAATSKTQKPVQNRVVNGYLVSANPVQGQIHKKVNG